MTLIYKKSGEVFSNEQLEVKIADSSNPKLTIMIKQIEPGVIEICKTKGTIKFAINDKGVYETQHRDSDLIQHNEVSIENAKNRVNISSDLTGLYYIKIKTGTQETMIGVVDYKRKKVLHCWTQSKSGFDHYETGLDLRQSK